MLGLARASQYAGWWNNNALTSVAFSGAGAVADVVEQSPAYSWLTNNSSQEWALPRTFAPGGPGSLDITGLTGFTGFNNRRSTVVASVYVSSLGSNTGAAWNNVLTISGSDFFYNLNMSVSTVSGTDRFTFDYYGTSVNTPTVNTNYLNQWLTIVGSTAETSSVFTNWTGGTVTGTAVRLCIYNTLTGALIAKSDYNNAGAVAPTLNTLPNTLTCDTTGTNNFFCNGYADPTSVIYTTNWWVTLGQCFDPVSATDTSWRTSSPSAEISSAKAWINAQYTNVATVSAVSHYGLTSGQDLYSQANNYLLDWTNAAPVWLLGYNTTIILRNST